MKRNVLFLNLILMSCFLKAQVVPGSKDNFITYWNTFDDNSLTIPVDDSGYNYDLYWEDINDSKLNGHFIAQTNRVTISGLKNNNDYKIEIAGVFPRPFFINSPNLKLIAQWGNINWLSMENAFANCELLDIVATDIPNLNNVNNCNNMFFNCSSMIGKNANWNWNTSNITTMVKMFYGANKFNQNIGNWNTSKITDFSMMFMYASSFNQNIGNWNTENSTNMSRMFYGAYSFNQNIGNWNTSKVSNMSAMFREAKKFNQNLSSWNTINVTNMQSMFYRADKFNNGEDSGINNWKTNNVIDFDFMFDKAIEFNQNIGNWDLSSAIYLNQILNNCGMDCKNYSKTLIGWASHNNLPSNLVLFSFQLQYGTNADSARRNLINNKSWNIIGDKSSGSDCSDCSDFLNLETLSNNRINLFPNPAHSFLNIEAYEATEIQVFNINGAKLLSQNIEAGINKINIESLPPGIYMVLLENKSFKIVKN